ADSLVIGAELGDGDYWLVLFVVLAGGHELTAGLTAAVKARIRAQASPRHVPDDVIAVPALPHTRTGKRLEVPVKRIIQGRPLATVAGSDAVDDPAALAQLAPCERQGRDRGWWEEMAGSFWPDSRDTVTWYDGDGPGFAARSRGMA